MIVKVKCGHCEHITAMEFPEPDHSSPRERIRQLEDALEAMVGYENDECHFDHHGYCQSHPGNHRGQGHCALAEGRKLLGIPDGATEREKS